MAGTKCRICLADEREEWEVFGLQALDGSLSWREASRLSDLRDGTALRTHMQNHYSAAAAEAALDEAQQQFDEWVQRTIEENYAMLETAPPDVKPLILVEIHNLRGLKHTKASQQHLLMGAKAKMEMTGGTPAQRLMLAFAASAFKQVLPAPSELPDNTIDVEGVEDE